MYLLGKFTCTNHKCKLPQVNSRFCLLYHTSSRTSVLAKYSTHTHIVYTTHIQKQNIFDLNEIYINPSFFSFQTHRHSDNLLKFLISSPVFFFHTQTTHNYALSQDHTSTLTSCFPMLPPFIMDTNALPAFSKPSVMVSFV
jgi:hypothetical protein